MAYAIAYYLQIVPKRTRRGNKVDEYFGISALLALAIVSLVHHSLTLKEAAVAMAKNVKPEGVPNDNGLFYFSLAFAVLHIIVFGAKMAKKK